MFYVLSSKVNYPPLALFTVPTLTWRQLNLHKHKLHIMTEVNLTGPRQTYLNSDGVANSHGAALLPVCYITFSVG